MSLTISSLLFLFVYPYLINLLSSKILFFLAVASNLILLFRSLPFLLSRRFLFFNISMLALCFSILANSATPFYSLFATFRVYYIPFAIFSCFTLYADFRQVLCIKSIVRWTLPILLVFQLLELSSIHYLQFLLPVLQPANDLGIYSRPIGFLQDYQSVPFIMGLTCIHSLARRQYKLLFFVFCLLVFSGMRTHLFSFVGSTFLLIFLLLLPGLFLRLRISYSQVIFLVVFLAACLFFVLPILVFQIVADHTSFSIATDYVAQDYGQYLSHLKLFGSGVLDYSNSNLNYLYSEVVLRNEIGFVRVFFEIGIIPAISLFVCLFRVLFLAFPGRKVYFYVFSVYILLGLLHHVTVFNTACSLFLAFFVTEFSSISRRAHPAIH